MVQWYMSCTAVHQDVHAIMHWVALYHCACMQALFLPLCVSYIYIAYGHVPRTPNTIIRFQNFSSLGQVLDFLRIPDSVPVGARQ